MGSSKDALNQSFVESLKAVSGLELPGTGGDYRTVVLRGTRVPESTGTSSWCCVRAPPHTVVQMSEKGGAAQSRRRRTRRLAFMFLLLLALGAPVNLFAASAPPKTANATSTQFDGPSPYPPVPPSSCLPVPCAVGVMR